MPSRPRIAVERPPGRVVERPAEPRASPAAGHRSASAQDLLADGQPDERLGLVGEERQVAVEHAPGLERSPRPWASRTARRTSG